MKTLFLSSLITFCILIAYLNKRHSKMEKKMQEAFWERERQANSVRKKPLNTLNYITIPLEALPTHLLTEHPRVKECLALLQSLSAEKIVNLTGFTNTDLKLEYGTANITVLTEYDSNYTLLARTLQEWAEVLYEEGYVSETRTILEFALSTDTDVSHSYYLLADIYDGLGNTEGKARLIEQAGNLRSVLSQSIVRTLQESGPYCDWLHCE